MSRNGERVARRCADVSPRLAALALLVGVFVSRADAQSPSDRADAEVDAAQSESQRFLAGVRQGRFLLLGGDLELTFGGRLHLDAATFREDAEISSAFGAPDAGFELRRAYLNLAALYRDRYEFKLEASVAGDTGMRDLYVALLEPSVTGGLRAGYFKEPLGLEELGSSNDTTFMERSLTNALVPGRDVGLTAYRGLGAARRSTFTVGFFQDADPQLEFSDGYGVTGRVTGLPYDADGGRRLIHVGLAATYRVPSNDTLRFRSRPESHLAQFLVDTGSFAATRDFRIGLETALVLNSLSLQSEFILSAPGDTPSAGSPVFPAFYLTGSYILTGEHRSYLAKAGHFGRVHPEGKLGAWELAGRYSYLDLDSAGVSGGVLHDWTAGLNWYWGTHSRVMFNYIAAHPEGFGVEQIAQVRLQLAF